MQGNPSVFRFARRRSPKHVFPVLDASVSSEGLSDNGGRAYDVVMAIDRISVIRNDR